MQKISVVIVCKNEEEQIGRCLKSLEGMTDDIVVLDNGSTDKTKEIIRTHKVRLVEDRWEGFGKTKNKATRLAHYNWILNLDADESLDGELRNAIEQLSLSDTQVAFELNFRNFFGEKYLRFGEWGNDRHVRLFNRETVSWDEANVHEALIIAPDIKIMRLQGYVLHYTVKSIVEYAEKTQKYAMLSALKYAQQGRKSSLVQVVFAPFFAFLKYYFFQLGFLDGRKGFICARMTAYYTFLKYARLLELNRQRA